MDPMAMSNAEKQAARWRERHEGYFKTLEQKVLKLQELQGELKRLREVKRLHNVEGVPSNDLYAKEERGDFTATLLKFGEWFETEIVEGRLAPATVDAIGSSAQILAKKYWGKNGQRGVRERIQPFARETIVHGAKPQPFAKGTIVQGGGRAGQFTVIEDPGPAEDFFREVKVQPQGGGSVIRLRGGLLRRSGV
jgi:hypothetical protein